MFVVILLIGYMFGYQAGYKAEKTLKQQISRLKGTIRKHNQSRQLNELSMAELRRRDDWDFRSRLAELTGAPPQTPDDPRYTNDDPNSMDRTFPS